MIGIIDYKSGNIGSIKNILEKLGAEYIISDDPSILKKTNKLIFPGQGRAGPAMEELKNRKLDIFIKNTKKPFLGICLGMQLLLDYSQEDNTQCLGIIPGQVRKFGTKYPVPQIGWNKIELIGGSNIIPNETNGEYFYFINSYIVETNPEFIFGITNYGGNFASIIQKDNYTGLQFHPEKSGDLGIQIIESFLKQPKISFFETSNLAKRVITCMDIKNGRVVKGTGYKSLKDSGDPVEMAIGYSNQGVDELVFLDIGATVEDRPTLYDLVRKVSQNVNVPLTVGGGIKSMSDIDTLLKSGADKVSIGSVAISNPELIKKAVEKYGSQCITISIDPKLEGENWIQYISGGNISTGKNTLEFAIEMEALGVGELLVNSLNRDGTKSGYDIALLKAVKERVNISVIASSGAGKLEDFYQVISEANVDAVLAAGLFHSNTLTIDQVKEYLKSKNVNIR